MLNFNNIVMDYEPFPIGAGGPAMNEDLFDELSQAFPDVGGANHRHRLGDNKYFINATKGRDLYRTILQNNKRWKEFDSYIRDGQCTKDAMDFLLGQGIDLGYYRPTQPIKKRLRTALGDIVKRKRLPEFPIGLYARMEFSMMPSDAGGLRPHTDDEKKIVTIIVHMNRLGEWKKEWGGGLSIGHPKDPKKYYNKLNEKLDFSEMQLEKTFENQPNSMMLFIKTFNSWHWVAPLQGIDTFRKTLTINIETN